MTSVSMREHKRERYIQGWYQLDADLLISTTTADFIFDDPAEPDPITREMLSDYMLRWDRRLRALGGNNQWTLTHEMRNDHGGTLTDWEWWRVKGTELQGAALILTRDEGVLFERITYFDRDIHRPWAT